MRFNTALLTLLAAVLSASLPQSSEAEKIPVVATTGFVAEVVRAVGGEAIELTQLCGPGVDPHLYKPTPSDIAALRRAKAVFYNGHHLEGRMTDILEKMGRSKPVLAVTADIPTERILQPEGPDDYGDPHLWNDPSLWKTTAGVAARGLAEAAPDKAEAFQTAAAAYAERLEALHVWCLEKAAELPEEKRILITSHDAYNYLGRAYGFQVVAPQGISTVGEAGSADIVKTIDFIKEHGVKAVFVESSVSPKIVERIARDSGAVIGGELFSDAMGAPGEMRRGFDTGTYEGLIRYNLTTIVDSLK